MHIDHIQGRLAFLQEAERLKSVLRSAHTSTGRAESTAEFKTLEDLSGLKVSVAVGSALEEELRKANEALKAAGKPEMNILALQSGTDAFQQLTAGLADAYFGSTDQAELSLIVEPSISVEEAPPPVRPEPLTTRCAASVRKSVPRSATS